MGNRSRTNLWSPAERYGFIALALALAMFFLQPAMAVLPLAIFLLGCFAAPFFPRSSFFLPVISRASTATGEIALTFDDGPSPASTPLLLDLLARYQLPATFFVVGENAARYPELITAILAGGHTIGNHSLRHDYFLMLRAPKTLQADIRATQEILAKSGVIPLVFRPPIGITGPRLGRVLAGENLITVTYSCRAFDRGNRDISNLAGRILRRLRPGAIVMLHDLPPLERTRTDQWQQELDRLFSLLKETNQVVPLAEIIQGPVMRLLRGHEEHEEKN